MIEQRHFKYDDKDHMNGKWVNMDRWSVNPYSVWQEEDDEDHEDYMEIAYEDRIYSGRNYWLFGLLAGVCASELQAFADKGRPSDASPEVNKAIDDYGEDGYSHSYLTLAELEAFDWHQPWGELANYLTQEELNCLHPDSIIEVDSKGVQRNDEPMRYRTRYKASAAQACPKFIETINKMRERMERRNDVTPDDIRLVFWFDN